MSLIKCPECGKEVSDRANACPNCGYPIAELRPRLVEMREDDREELWKKIKSVLGIESSFIAKLDDIKEVIEKSGINKEDIIGYYDDKKVRGELTKDSFAKYFEELSSCSMDNIVEFVENKNHSWKANFNQIIYVGEDEYIVEARDVEERNKNAQEIDRKIQMYQKKMLLNRTAASLSMQPSYNKGISASTGAIIGGALAGTTGAIIGGLTAFEQKMKQQEYVAHYNKLMNSYDVQYTDYAKAISDLEQLKSVTPLVEIPTRRMVYGLKTDLGILLFYIGDYKAPYGKEYLVEKLRLYHRRHDIYHQETLVDKKLFLDAVKDSNIGVLASNKTLQNTDIADEQIQVDTVKSNDDELADLLALVKKLNERRMEISEENIRESFEKKTSEKSDTEKQLIQTEDKIDVVSRELKNLGLFKKKEKEELSKKLNSLVQERTELSSKVKEEKHQIEIELNSQLKLAKDESYKILKQMGDANRRIAEIKNSGNYTHGCSEIVNQSTKVETSNNKKEVVDITKLGMPKEIVPAKSSCSGTLVSWMESVNTAVEKGEQIAIVRNSEMADKPILAPVSGIVTEYKVKPGDPINSGMLIALISIY